jgi:hypothetical protein
VLHSRTGACKRRAEWASLQQESATGSIKWCIERWSCTQF